MNQVDPSGQPPLGMLSGAMQQPAHQPAQDSTRKPFNGVIEINGDKAQVVDGVLEYDGDRAFVSDDGSMVVMPDRTVVGHIVDGKFVEATPEHLQQLKSQGVLE